MHYPLSPEVAGQREPHPVRAVQQVAQLLVGVALGFVGGWFWFRGRRAVQQSKTVNQPTISPSLHPTQATENPPTHLVLGPVGVCVEPRDKPLGVG